MKNKKIYRKTDDCIIAGVCGGLADYFAIDETLVRIIFVILTIGGGSGILLYLVLWLVIPKEGKENNKNNWEENVKEFTQDVGKKAKTVAKEIKKEIKILLFGNFASQNCSAFPRFAPRFFQLSKN